MNKSTETLNSPKKTIGNTNPVYEKIKDDTNPYVKQYKADNMSRKVAVVSVPTT